MKGLAELTKTTLIGGLLVVLPIYLSILLLVKTIAGIFALLSPVTEAIPAGAQFRQVIAIVIALAVCLVAGLVVRTGAGLRAKNALERSVLEKIPGYALVRGLAERMSGDEATARSSRRSWNSRTRSHPASSSRSWRTGATPYSCRRCRPPRPVRCSSCRGSVCIPWTCRSRRR